MNSLTTERYKHNKTKSYGARTYGTMFSAYEWDSAAVTYLEDIIVLPQSSIGVTI